MELIFYWGRQGKDKQIKKKKKFHKVIRSIMEIKKSNSKINNGRWKDGPMLE